MRNPWSAFYWRDHIGDTGHLTLAQHGAYLLLMAHYYMTGKPIPANAEQVHRICRCTNDADRHATERVLSEFFTLDGEAYRHSRIEAELQKAADISAKRRAAAEAKHKKKAANAQQMHVQMQTQPQPQSQSQSQQESPRNSKARAGACAPTLAQVTAYCAERGNRIDPQQWFDHYSANGWKVGRVPMRDWMAAVRKWERNGVNRDANGNGNRAQQRQANNLAALDAAFPLDR